MNFGQRQIIDFFWNRPDYTFNINDASPRSGQIPIYNLHGGLHLWQDSATKETGKWTHQGGNDPIIDSLDRYYQGQPSRQPLFVSEGSPEHKLRTIRGSDYLSFALNTLATDDDNIVVFGSSLSAICQVKRDTSVQFIWGWVSGWGWASGWLIQAWVGMAGGLGRRPNRAGLAW